MDIRMTIEEIMNKGIFNKNIVEAQQLSGGTTSKLYLLIDSEDRKYVVKFNEPHVLEAESHFLTFYQDVDLLPDLLYTDPSYRYIVYSFIAGSVDYHRKNKKELLNTLVQNFINHYKPISDPVGWGWADELTDSWQGFLLSRVDESSKILESYLEKEDHRLVFDLVKSPNRMNNNSKPFLLHGDFGVHNFIFNEAKLDGVIDPTPVYGVPLYDFIYAFCSSPDDLTKETINLAAKQLITKANKSVQQLYEDVLIGLYLRISTCIRFHPEDLKEYLEAWSYWKNVVKATPLKK
jgi:aminoglycoside phosphotransferase